MASCFQGRISRSPLLLRQPLWPCNVTHCVLLSGRAVPALRSVGLEAIWWLCPPWCGELVRLTRCSLAHESFSAHHPC
jgi:hypothetical protein